MPSTVRTSWPSAIAASTVHDLTGSPSMSTTQAPQLRGVAAPVGAGQAERVAQEVHEQQCAARPRRDASSPLTVSVTCIGLSSVRSPARARRRGAGRAGSARRRGGACSRRARAGRRSASSPRRRAAAASRERLLRRRGWPRSASSARVARTSRGPTAVSAMPAVGDRAAVEPQRGAGGGDRPVAGAALDLLVGAAAVRSRIGSGPRSSISASPTAVSYGPWWKSSMLDRRARRRAPRITARAPSAAQTADRSSDGSAWHSAPPIVPRLRTTGSAMTLSASGRSGSARASSVGLEQLAVARHRADADLVAVLADVAELGQVVDVDQVLGRRQAQLHHRQQAVPAGDERAPRARAARAAPARRRRWTPARTRTAQVPAWAPLLHGGLQGDPPFPPARFRTLRSAGQDGLRGTPKS